MTCYAHIGIQVKYYFDMQKKESKKYLNEPFSDYETTNKRHLTCFKSFEEAEEATLLQRISMTPEERLVLVTRMLEQFYDEELKQSKKYSRITFDD